VATYAPSRPVEAGNRHAYASPVSSGLSDSTGSPAYPGDYRLAALLVLLLQFQQEAPVLREPDLDTFALGTG
jgi:hypothetical protein